MQNEVSLYSIAVQNCVINGIVFKNHHKKSKINMTFRDVYQHWNTDDTECAIFIIGTSNRLSKKYNFTGF